MDLLGNLGKKVSNTVKTVQDRTKEGLEIARLTTELKNAQASMEKLYASLGRAYYENDGNDPDGELKRLCEQVDGARIQIDSIRKRQDKLNGQSRCPGCGAVAPSGNRFCAFCGCKLEEPAQEPDTIATDDLSREPAETKTEENKTVEIRWPAAEEPNDLEQPGKPEE